MELTKVLILFLIILATFSLGNCFASSKLPVLAMKQSINNLRYFSSDGKFTLYQKRSGDLLISTNFKVSEILKGIPGTNYLVSASNTKKKMIVSQNNYYSSYFSQREKEKLFTLDYGTNKVTEIGEGTSPKLHLNDSWLSYYNSYTSTLHFKNIQNNITFPF